LKAKTSYLCARFVGILTKKQAIKEFEKGGEFQYRYLNGGKKGDTGKIKISYSERRLVLDICKLHYYDISPSRKKFIRNMWLKLMHASASGMACLHYYKIIHGDLKVRYFYTHMCLVK